MSDERPFVTIQHPISKRWAFLEDDGMSAWLYITESADPVPIASCLIYSCLEPVPSVPADWKRGVPPPLTHDYATDRALQLNAEQAKLQLGWETNGRAVVVLMDDEPVAFMLVEEKRGYSKSVLRSGPYGEPWDDDLFEETFRANIV